MAANSAAAQPLRAESQADAALSVGTYGESGDPASPHFNDQASLFVKGQFKPSWFTPDEVKKNAESVYHPGDEATGSE
ncbi:MAG TPA: penicillin acylase family protein [Candidatus Binatia bacterium]|nr:penicillin acylase family protein [Candidatus Binatia bacterium]